MNEKPTQEQFAELTEQLRAALDGKEAELQGMALAEIVSMYFAAHNPDIRSKVIRNWMRGMRELIRINERTILALGGWERPGRKN